MYLLSAIHNFIWTLKFRIFGLQKLLASSSFFFLNIYERFQVHVQFER